MSTDTSTPEPSSGDTQHQDAGPGVGETTPDHSETGSAEPQEDTADSEDAEGSHEIETQQQMQFGADGSLEPAEETVETTLRQFDVDVSHRDPDTRIERPEASGIMRDDRPEAQSSDGGEQSNLFVDAEEDQQTLDGKNAQNQCLFEDDE